jgi:hypothetical protein
MTTANAVLNKGFGMPGRTALTWAVAGAVGFGGVVVGVNALAGNLNGNGLLMTALALFVIGAMLGFLHGAVLGVMGRPREMTWQRAARAVALAAMYAVPALTVTFLVAGWIALTPVAIYTGKLAALIGCAIAWIIGTGLICYAAVQGWRALRAAYERWDEKRNGTLLVAATFAALLTIFLAKRPELWGLQLRFTEVGAVLLALSMTLWLVGPFVTVALKLMKKLPVPGAAYDKPARALPGIVMGLATGVVLALVAIPFAITQYGVAGGDVGPAGAVVAAVSAALFNEVLLRLFVVTAVAALVLRWHAGQREEAVGIAVLAAAGVEVLLHLPGVVMIGFPTMFGAAAFLVTAVVLPAIAFGMLYWKRGLTTAVVAHATALTMIALVAA